MAEKEDHFDLFFRRKPAMMLIALKRMNKAKYGSVIAKEEVTEQLCASATVTS